MNEKENKFRTFEDLEVYKLARQFRKRMYTVSRNRPDLEKFGLAGQIRRAAVSLTNNIAEGHGRYHYLDQIKFMLQSRRSLEELVDDINICEDEKYLTPAETSALKNEAWQVRKFINGYVRYLREQKAGSSQALRETSSTYGAMNDELDEILLGVSFNPLTF
jgi:four helix bundle protein